MSDRPPRARVRAVPSPTPPPRVGPSRREVLAVGALAPVAGALGFGGGPTRRLWILLAGAPAAVDVLSEARPHEDRTPTNRGVAPRGCVTRRRAAAGRSVAVEKLTGPGWGGSTRVVWRAPSPFAPCGTLTDALSSVAVRGAFPVRGLRAPAAEPALAARRIEAVLGSLPRAARPLAALDLLERAPQAWTRVDLDWGRLRGLRARAAALDAELANLLRALDERGRLDRTELILVGACGRAPFARLAGRREPTPDDPLFAVLGRAPRPARPGEALLDRVGELSRTLGRG